ncbi:YTH domain-containing protein 1 [Ceratitis capitata]|uniref:(Mediterranean fruit fly) hypothetical protein n=1 Tax=Ceratitis capitata TaxID=7213 RepID=W8AJJ8_CERCA|nr:YTH domain-containing protein 1 [Ceratitis capitata]CAD7014451.1 unnamed protein product [Ceratitis capitata]
MKRNDSQFSHYPSPGRDSPPRLRQRLSQGSKFHEIFNKICAIEKHLFKENKEKPHSNSNAPENQASETASESGNLEIDVVNVENDGMSLDCSLLTPDSLLTGEEDMEEYEEEFEEGEDGEEGEEGEEDEEGEEGEELDEGLYDDGAINEESVYSSLPQDLLNEYELAALEYSAINAEWRNGSPKDCRIQKRLEYPEADITSNFISDQNRNANPEIPSLTASDNGPTTSRRACESLASLQETAWMHQPNFQPSTAYGTEPVDNTNLFKQPALRKEYQKLLRQTYFLTKRAK